MAMTISWTTSTIGTVHYTVPDNEVMDKVKAVQALGFEPSVSIPKE